ncbi:MAG: 2-oxoacid:acceptor oxidoreductase subunit alpha, partial [Ignisphaera sp.]
HIESFYDAIEAFNIAERFQVPVIHLLDKFLANSTRTIPPLDLDTVRIARGSISSGGIGYKRFDLGSTVSPRAFLGVEDTVMWYTGDEHDEYGHIAEDSVNRVAMYSKRVRKLELIASEIPRDRKLTVYGDYTPDYILIGWGSVKGVALDAIESLYRRGFKGSYVNLRLLWPFPSREVVEILTRVPRDRVIAIEHSYSIQIADLVPIATGIRIEKRIAKFTGRPITLNELDDALSRILTSDVEHVVLTHGA